MKIYIGVITSTWKKLSYTTAEMAITQQSGFLFNLSLRCQITPLISPHLFTVHYSLYSNERKMSVNSVCL